jgi:hypothetical protein
MRHSLSNPRVPKKCNQVMVTIRLERNAMTPYNIAPRGLSMEWHLPFSILLHFLEFVFHNNGLVDHVLEIGVVGVEQLELNIIIQSL